MSISLPSETVFHSIERAIKEYRKFSQKKHFKSDKGSNYRSRDGIIVFG
jgi:hypothetical protein